MYHIKEDKRCVRSALAIADALEHLMKRKPFLSISVSDLQKESGVGRSTFYRLFDNIDDVISYMIDTQFRELVFDGENASWHEFTRKSLSYIIEKSDVILSIVNAGRTDLITRSFSRTLQNIIENEKTAAAMHAKYSLAVFASACISVLSIWYENGRAESLDELADILERYLNYEELYATGIHLRHAAVVNNPSL